MTTEKIFTAAVIVLLAFEAVISLVAAAWKFTEADFVTGTVALVLSLAFSFVTYTGIAIFRSENRRRKA